MSNLLTVPTTDLRQLLDFSDLPSPVKQDLNHSLYLVDLANQQFKLASSKPTTEPEILSGLDYHKAIKPFLRIANYIVTASEVFLASRPDLPTNLSTTFETTFSEMLTKLETFCEKSIRNINAKHPEFKTHFRKNHKSGGYLQMIATATFNGNNETPVSQTEIARFADVSTAAVTGLRDVLHANKYVDLIEVKGDRRKICTLLTPLGWQALAYYETKVALQKIKLAHNGLSNAKTGAYSVRTLE